MLRKLFGAARAPKAASGAAVPPGVRVYAVGDVHGRLDLLDELLSLIDADTGDVEPTMVFLGDLVDRGPDSAGVVDRVATLAASRPSVHTLMGNHEEIMLGALDGDAKAMRLFCRIGGRETAQSYGITADDYERLGYDELHERLSALVPAHHRTFMAAMGAMVTIGDYAFVHAGIRPGVPLADQLPGDLRWIRQPFLDHRAVFEKTVVHGHTITRDVVIRPNRIGIDTGAYESGRLTALALADREVRILQTGG